MAAVGRLAADVPEPEFDLKGEPVAQGLVVNMIDQRVWNPTPDMLSYSLSKAALWAATQMLAQALAEPDLEKRIAAFENERRFLPLDLIFAHEVCEPMLKKLREHGLEEDYRRFLAREVFGKPDEAFASDAHLAEHPDGGGWWYPGPTYPYAGEPVMGWQDVISSIYIE